ncbi:MAG: hypothetical protein HY308_04215 [Gammaproteobacteria bacterium]|nr:hypothetical protein [Gammaproteobacteria bacterium]
MQVGINYPWIHCDWDFGQPPVNSSGDAWGTRADWRSRIESDLEQYRQLGIFAVRWWVLGSGLLYGIGTEAPRLSSGSWQIASVPRLAQAVIDDFASALPFFRRANIKLMPVFADFRMFLDPSGTATDYVSGGRQQLISDSAQRPQFLRNALRALLEASRGFSDIIYAWDLCNEPEWCVRNPGSGVPRGSRPTLDLSSMLAFLREGVAMINSTGLRSSIGFASHATVDAWRSIELQVRLHQFHYYPHDLALPRHTFSAEYPLIIGEFASAPHRPWPELAEQERREPENIVCHRLQHAQSRGYPAAFIWSAEEHPSPPDPGQPQPVAWDDDTREQIRRFTGYAPR